MRDLREDVARAIYGAWNISGVPYDSPFIQGNLFRQGKAEAQADAAIAAVIERLIADDAKGTPAQLDPLPRNWKGDWCLPLAEWLRTYLPTEGGDK